MRKGKGAGALLLSVMLQGLSFWARRGYLYAEAGMISLGKARIKQRAHKT
jgi:hypothetical protein